MILRSCLERIGKYPPKYRSSSWCFARVWGSRSHMAGGTGFPSVSRTRLLVEQVGRPIAGFCFVQYKSQGPTWGSCCASLRGTTASHGHRHREARPALQVAYRFRQHCDPGQRLTVITAAAPIESPPVPAPRRIANYGSINGLPYRKDLRPSGRYHASPTVGDSGGKTRLLTTTCTCVSRHDRT